MKRYFLGQAGTDLFLMDYVMSAILGSNAEFYVSGSLPCGNNTKYLEIDAIRTHTNFKLKPDYKMTKEGQEDMFFNVTATLSGYLPDVIYYCYFIPGKASSVWNNHYKHFYNLKDFEAGFI